MLEATEKNKRNRKNEFYEIFEKLSSEGYILREVVTDVWNDSVMEGSYFYFQKK